MKTYRYLQIFLMLTLAVSLAGCNLPQAKPAAITKLVTATPRPATNTPLPPTETATPEPPTATPTQEIPPSPLPEQPTLVFSTQEPTRTPTPVVYKPAAHARFDGTYEYGKLVLRIDNNPIYIVPKSVTIKGAPCKEGKGKKSDTLTLEPPRYYEIKDGKFYIDFDGIVKISGEFISPLKARGTITIYLKQDGKNCTIGPYAWVATTEAP